MRSNSETGYALIFLFEIAAMIGGAIWEDRKDIREYLDLRKTFSQAGIPVKRSSVMDVREAIFNRGGNCSTLKSELHEPCESAKKALHVQYNPNGTVQSWQRP